MDRWAPLIALALVACDGSTRPPIDRRELPDGFEPSTGTLEARLIAVGVRGATAVRQIGEFLPQSPIRTNAPFAAFIADGQILDADRLFVASTSNYGAPLARGDHGEGSVLSIDSTQSATLVIPRDFAVADGQAVALDGAVRTYSAQSPTFLNSVYHPDAVTASFPAVGNPLGISINNAFGRPWFANAPVSGGAGTIAVIDPDGRPLAAIVSRAAGGVFAGDQTNRAGQIIPGSLAVGSIGTALLGPSPDGSRRAVFAALTADGSIVQVHVEKGVDGLAPPDTIQSVTNEIDRARSDPRSPVTHVGIAFNWVPQKVLFIPDPLRNAVLRVELSQDATVFRVSEVQAFTSDFFDAPLDVAPAVVELISPDFASGTTLAGGADLYLANRGNGTIVRITQDGIVIASRTIIVPGLGELGPNRINGLATSVDASRIFVTVSGTHPDFAGEEGLVVEVEAFGAPDAP